MLRARGIDECAGEGGFNFTVGMVTGSVGVFGGGAAMRMCVATQASFLRDEEGKGLRRERLAEEAGEEHMCEEALAAVETSRARGEA